MLRAASRITFDSLKQQLLLPSHFSYLFNKQKSKNFFPPFQAPPSTTITNLEVNSRDFYTVNTALMENSLASVHRGHTNFSSSLLLSRNRQPCAISCPSNGYGRQQQQQLKQSWKNNKRSWKVVNCAKGGGGGPVEEIITEEELMGFGRLRDKCKEETINGGIAELLECLEREAIMGEDEGKEPTDYNRRAQIFHKSSRVFQALKETTSATAPTNTS